MVERTPAGTVVAARPGGSTVGRSAFTMGREKENGAAAPAAFCASTVIESTPGSGCCSENDPDQPGPAGSVMPGGSADGESVSVRAGTPFTERVADTALLPSTTAPRARLIGHLRTTAG